ncbi:MAG: hypothetical protein WCF22_19135 [Candidatus Sulfotelmatobacter sp.]
MSKRTNIAWFTAMIALLVAASVMLGGAIAQTKAATPKAQDKLALGEEQAKQLLLLIDTEKRGKISKQEWMKFMEAEFDKLDKDKSGQLDVKELGQSKLRVSPSQVSASNAADVFNSLRLDHGQSGTDVSGLVPINRLVFTNMALRHLPSGRQCGS